MAFPTSLNSQITDSVTQADVQVLGDAPAIAMGNVYQAVAQALANAAHNATNAQQQNFVLAEAVIANCVRALLGSAPAA
ncbi:RebB family R body protein [Bradyrhizobium genosp. P]|uniref:RebB family R body protein n=1 Tax=Bradyrhizobium genosp. P TaxID=83641 RepID=UPI003CEB29CA